jgi:uncharacterized protein
MQAILLLSIVILIYFVLRYLINVIIDARARLKEESGEGVEPESQAMVRCAHCGIHLPQSEAYYDGQHTYCSEGHLKLGPKIPQDTEKHETKSTEDR